jgi:hypothetical protein
MPCFVFAKALARSPEDVRAPLECAPLLGLVCARLSPFEVEPLTMSAKLLLRLALLTNGRERLVFFSSGLNGLERFNRWDGFRHPSRFFRWNWTEDSGFRHGPNRLQD